MFTLAGIDHIAITVRDVRQSIDWYQSVLGLERRHAEAWGDYPAVVGIGTTSVALVPQRGSPAAAPGPDARTMRHLAFRADADNFARARRELANRGITCDFQDHDIAHSIYFHDPDGYQIEITTYELHT